MQSSSSRFVHEQENYFFALEPPLAARALIVEQADRVAREHALGGRSVKFSCLHVTLCGIGRAERLREPVLPVLRRAAEAVRAATVEVGFDRLATFRLGGDNHALVLRCTPQTGSALRFLRTAIGHAQYAQGLYLPGASRFEAHVAARYLPRPLGSEIEIEPVAWQAQEFVLIRSLAGRGVHEIVERWPLATA
jgi:RNA 2',3'-cyclic 3'-phosphodiesterase